MIQIKYRDKVVSSDKLHEMGWKLINAGKTQDRYAIQLAQSKANQASAKERAQADRAGAAALRAARAVLAMVEELQQ